MAKKKVAKAVRPPTDLARRKPTGPSVIPAGYDAVLADLKSRIRAAQIRAAQSVNQELLWLYFDIGFELHRRTQREAWGSSVIDRLSADLHRAFPEMTGFSPRNLRRMRAFYEAYPLSPAHQEIWPRAVAKFDLVTWPPAVAKLPWAHNVILLEKCKAPDDRAWYAAAALEHGWSRDILALQIDSGLHERQGRAVTNFRRTLPAPQSDLAQQLLKDPYNFDFLTLATDAHEREAEDGLLAHIRQFLLELGVGFAFVGQQYPLEVGGDEFSIDLLFYHCRLHCYFVIDLKMRSFEPEHAGKMSFYLSAVDEQLRNPVVDQPTIGLILCRDQNRLVAEYALRDTHKPISVAGWTTKLVASLPKNLRGSLPTIEELEAELGTASPPTKPSRQKKVTGKPTPKKAVKKAKGLGGDDE